MQLSYLGLFSCNLTRHFFPLCSSGDIRTQRIDRQRAKGGDGCRVGCGSACHLECGGGEVGSFNSNLQLYLKLLRNKEVNLVHLET